MTCIAGWRENGLVTIGGDSAGGSAAYCEVRADEKVFKLGEFLMGFTTSFRMGQLLRYSLVLPILQERQDLFQFMVCDFVDAVRLCLKTGGFARKKDEVEQGGTFIVGFRGHLYSVDSDYQVSEVVEPYCAVGCGAPLALGAMYALMGLKMSPKRRVQKALEAAETWSGWVRRPFKIITIKGKVL